MSGCIIQAASAQSKEVKFLLDTSMTIMKATLVNADNVHWRKLNRQVLKKAKGIDHPYDLGPVMRYLYRSVGDFHGWFIYKDSSFKWQRDELPVSDSIKNEWNKGVTVRSGLPDSNIGYVLIPYMSYNGKEDADKNAQRLNDSLCSLLAGNISGLIVDLRLNGGGAMFPMILGLEQLLGTGKVGSFVGKDTQTYYIKEHRFMLEEKVMTGIIPKCIIDATKLPVVVLIGQGTGSSGEFLAMAFKGRSNTLFLGKPTAGYVTSTKGFSINGDAFILLSTAWGRDRNDRVYKEAIQPDIILDSPDNFNNLNSDEKVKAAINWLRKQVR